MTETDDGTVGMDEAIARARAQARLPRRLLPALLAALLVGVAAFAAGRAWPPSTGPEAGPTTRPAEAAAAMWTCSMHPQVIEPAPGICPICHMELTPLESSDAEAGTIRIDPVVVQNMGVRVAEAARGPLVQSVRAVGYLEEPAPLHRDINLRVNGWIERLHANVDGMPVRRGEPLFDLYSPELSVAIDELIAARAQAGRGDALASSLLDAARRKLLQYGLLPEQIEALATADAAPATVAVLAPIDGHLTDKMVYEGAAVKAGDLVMRLASRHRMWIDAQVPEASLPLISDAQPARATLVSQPGRVYSGRVLFVHPHMDEATRTARVRIEIDNEGLLLRQGMYATVEILADAYREAVLVPREAVIDTGRRRLAFVALGEGRFEPRELTLGLSGVDGGIEVLSGLQAGEQVVVSGQFLLDSESRLKEALAKHLAAGLPGHAGHAGPPIAAGSASGEPSTRPAARLDVPEAEALLKAYLDLARRLGERQTRDEPLDPRPMIEAASRSAAQAQGDAAALVGAVVEAAGGMRDTSLAEQRAAFVPLSEAMIALVAGARLPAGPALYVMHCPMAFDDRGARWLQDEPTLANPYYATQMKRCGEVVERIDLPR